MDTFIKCLPLVGVVVGSVLTLLTTFLTIRLARRRELKDAFAAEVGALRRDLQSRGDNLDMALFKWHRGTLAPLRLHVDYFTAGKIRWWQCLERRWWKRTKQAWDAYEMAGQFNTGEDFLAKRITAEMLRAKLADLYRAIRED